MAFDATFMGAVLQEIRGQALGSRVEKIHQPARDTLILLLRCEGGRKKLLFAMNPAAPRLHFTENSLENPAEPPMFCMLLRKHLSGGRLSGVEQIPMERCATFTFDCTDEMGYPVQKKLICELMGRTCNLYLLNPEGRIIDCLRRVGLDESSRRSALPGLMYQYPDPVKKENVREMELPHFVEKFSLTGPDLISERLMERFGGLSPLVCREAALFAAGDIDARVCDLREPEKLFAFLTARPRPWYTARQFAFCPIREYGECQEAESFSALLDGFYTARDQKDAMRQRSQAVRKTVSNLCQRQQRKLAIQEKELLATHDRERLRQLGDIVTANLHAIRKGQTVLQAEDFYDEDMPLIDIPISPILSPQQNAAKFYKDYARMKTAEKELTKQISLGTEELQYLQSVLEELNRAGSAQELEEIRQELQAGGYLREDTGKRKPKQGKLPPMHFVSTDGYDIYVGRNNRQNDALTFKSARKDDLWLHASKVHGSHVVIACAGVTPPDNTVTQAAQLAAYYSESMGGQNIPVDVTPVKQVKKPGTGKPGMVIYHSYRTVIANPYPDIRIDPLNAE